ncbi:high-affinity choline transporter 1 isoform X1 [Procambarus clarkii]|uniref:high-affinity choline transporter 1 isoform X1 n=2 Tax=Procambarus clarkii TaxID=6728 RepID=UPI00374483D1
MASTETPFNTTDLLGEGAVVMASTETPFNTTDLLGEGAVAMASTETPFNTTVLLPKGVPERDQNVPRQMGLIVLSMVILAIGLWVVKRCKRIKRCKRSSVTDEVIPAAKNFGTFVGILTMTATWVGGGYINGSAEAVFSSGLIWCQAPFGYAISLTLGGLFFAGKMREARYMTILDPLQDRYGPRWGAMLYLPALVGETLWSASILAALGSTLAIIEDLNTTVSIFLSGGVVVVYTLFDGFHPVAYPNAHRDVVQLFSIFLGLWLAVPFAMSNEAVGSLSPSVTDWLGSISADTPWLWGEWTDFAVLLIFGGIPWQAYFQRVLSARTRRQAEVLSYAGSVGCFLMAVPACFIGAIAKATDWPRTTYGADVAADDQKRILPLVMQHLTPAWVMVVGLLAVGSAFMMSADSSILFASSMFANNIYKNVIRRSASDWEVLMVMRVSVVVVAGAATVVAIKSNSIYVLIYLCGDLVYVMLFPQLTLAVHAPHHVNTYGSIAAYFLGFTLRILGGEKVLGLPPVIQYPYFRDGVQYFPFR